MRRFLYSPVLKAIAVLLCIAAAGVGAGFLTELAIDSGNYELFIADGNLSRDHTFARDITQEMQEIILAAAHTGRVSEPDSSKFNYYINMPEKGIELGDWQLAQSIEEKSYWLRYYNIDGDLWWDTDLSVSVPHWNESPVCEIILCYTPGYVANYLDGRGKGAALLDKIVYYEAVCALILLLSAVYLCFVCGRRAQDNEVHLLVQDRLFPEIQIAIAAGISIAALGGGVVALDELYLEDFDMLRKMLIVIECFAAGAITASVITVLLSIVRLLKNKTFVKSCLCTLIIAFAWKLAKKIIVFVWELVKKIVVFAISVLGKILGALYGFVRGACSRIHMMADTLITYKSSKVAAAGVIALSVLMFLLGVIRTFGTFAVAALLCLLAAAKVIKVIGSFEKISQAIRSMRGGNIENGVTLPETDYFHELADSLNSIGDGMRASVEKELKAERMKSELITNVSHDLKTPLTSIISYSDLLCELELEPQEANDYAEIIRKKGERLKNLTQDLFDVSKVQSGNEKVDIERIDLSLLISQALGESDSILEKAGLVQAVKLDKELFINSDGKKLSRVFENLIGNIVKYAQKGTRVFISAGISGTKIRAEFKNTSATPIDFDAEEITERFARGDQSRSTDGSGLGLAIAKSYTELCGGTFKVETDGDLFKVIMTFDKE